MGNTMSKTRIDDMLIEMITPKVEEIEKKFANREGLTHKDINTLLLKLLYNHISHLDQKLGEATVDVASLKGEFNSLKGEFNSLKGEFNSLKGEFALMKSDIEVTIQKALNKNMVMLIGMMGFFLTLSKLIDAFAK